MTNPKEPQLSGQQLERLEIFIQLKKRIITNDEAAKRLQMSKRQVQRKKKEYLEHGVSALIHKGVGKRSNNAYSDDFKEKVVELYKTEYEGWNFAHFRDAIEDDYAIVVSGSFVYNLLNAHGFKSPCRKKKRKDKSHPPRPRRECAGELIQVDASKHQWLYGTEEYFYLHGAIDDATGIVTACFMMEQETALGYQILMRDTIQRYGIPEALYSDYRTVFQSNKRLTLDETLKGKKVEATRFVKMLKRLGVDIHSTEDPRAKGRIERLWRTFQGRLVHELIKHKIGTLEEANRYINEVFLPKYNARFAAPIDDKRNSFVPITPSFDYNQKLALRYEHKVLEGCFIKHRGKYYEIKQGGMTATIRTHEPVEVCCCLDGVLRLVYDDCWYELELIERVEAATVKPVRKKLTPEELSAVRAENGRKSKSPWHNYRPNNRPPKR